MNIGLGLGDARQLHQRQRRAARADEQKARVHGLDFAAVLHVKSRHAPRSILRVHTQGGADDAAADKQHIHLAVGLGRAVLAAKKVVVAHGTHAQYGGRCDELAACNALWGRCIAVVSHKSKLRESADFDKDY